ncbi:thiamine diphosphokinase [Sporosarcina highlanderae]|uniref:Thiamine diphosphokinase n=1 Tax=Sporosarcina highlanderae TaxID=3035916 RepID=A0ABT8JR59_9BACL|nr:thiamine diphosphokinase [Sporosarcina highlanderae]MDN4607512.1 thiamine diphosphokinase [Sporosarcina highlanderae]
MKRVVICAGGPAEDLPDLLSLKTEQTIFIGVDRGSLHLLERGIVPVEAVGDFDSVNENEFAMIQSAVERVDSFNAEKNETDTELAITRAIAYLPDEIILTGVTGGRLDHFESALHLLYRIQVEYEDVLFTIKNVHNELSVLSPGTHLVNKNEGLPYVSFFPFGGAVEGITLTGFKYETVNARMEMGMTKFTSNEPIAEVCTISFLKGICLMVRSSDS